MTQFGFPPVSYSGGVCGASRPRGAGASRLDATSVQEYALKLLLPERDRDTGGASKLRRF